MRRASFSAVDAMPPNECCRSLPHNPGCLLHVDPITPAERRRVRGVLQLVGALVAAAAACPLAGWILPGWITR